MRSCKSLFNIAWLLGAIIAFVSCTTDVDYTLGEEFVPSNQQMELRRRVYALGECTEGDSSVECKLATTHLYRSDSLQSSNIGVGYFGRETNTIFGTRKAGFMSQMVFSLSLPEERGWGYRPIFDSMVLSLCITDFHGDTTKKHRFNVYEITSNDYLKLSKDTTLYVNFDPAPYVASEPIFTFEFPNQERGAYVGDMDDPQNATVLLEPTEIAEEYVKRLMLTTDLDDKDGYATDKDSIYVNGNELAFLDKVRGIYIAPAEDTDSVMFATNLSNTAMLLFARGRYEEDPSIIRDTTYMIYNMYLNPSEYTDLAAGNVSVNSIQHDYADSEVGLAEETEVCDVCYVEGMGGVVTELRFTDEFIQSLADIVLEHKESVVAVNQAHLSIYLDGSDYDYMMIDPMYITPILDSAMPRLGLYTDYADLIAVSDYLYSVEANYTIDFDGTLNRSLACYTMNISGFVQSLMNAAADNVDENGVVKLEKFAAGYEPASESLVSLRRAYIAPDAYSLFGLERQAINGSDGDVGGERCTAPIKLDMTYTIVN